MKLTIAILAVAVLALPAQAVEVRGFGVDVVTGGRTLRELHGRGAVYVEAKNDRPYELRLTNPLPVRVAVALAVDGRNTIDARRSSSWDAAKWVLEPYETTVITGWQVSGDTARLFTFTTEKKSYAAWLGDTSNLGVIEAVFYAEKERPRRCVWCERHLVPQGLNAPASDAAPAPAAAGGVAQSAAKAAAPRAEAVGDYAATGMGDATENQVTRISMALDPKPLAKIRIRYEFHDQLVALGLLRDLTARPPARREQAHGFSNYCPQP